MKSMTRRSLALFIALMMLLTSVVMAMPVSAAEKKTNLSKNTTDKRITIVYDDSGSMVNGDDGPTDNKKEIKRWSQAKYSLEAFTAMLGENDELNIHTLNNHKYDSIRGNKKDDAVRKIHSSFKNGDYRAGTSNKEVETAAKALINSENDKDKWLVIITDGEFDELAYKKGKNGKREKLPNDVIKSKTETFLQKYGKKLNGHLIYVTIGSGISYDEKDFIVKNANDGKDIIAKVQETIETIYKDNRNKVGDATPKNEGEACASIVRLNGLSVSQLIVFSQGDGAKVISTNRDEDVEIKRIPVKYTDINNAVNYDGSSSSFKGKEDKVIKTDKSLVGYVTIITPKNDTIVTNEGKDIKVYFEKSKSGKAPTVTIYYEPDVRLKYSLTQGDGEKKTVWLDENSGEKPCVSPGEYTFKADIVNVGTDESVNQEFVPELDVNFLGNAYTIDALRKGVKVNLDESFSGDDFDGEAYLLERKYTVTGIDKMNKMLKNMIVKKTYKLKVTFQMPTASTLSYKFRKTNFTLHSLKTLKSSDKKHSIRAIVSCENTDTGEAVELTQAQWDMIKNAVNSDRDLFKITKANTRVTYDDITFEDSVQKGVGVFYVSPDYHEDENGKPDKKKTTHKNYVHRSDKYLCSIGCDISLPDATEEIAYSTSAANISEKSSKFEIALCMWWTIIILFLFFWFLGYLLKAHLPSLILNKKYSKGVIENIVAKENYSGDLTNPNAWTPAKKDRTSRARIKRSKLSVLLPYYPQEGSIRLNPTKYSGGMKLKIRATSLMAKEFAIVNSANSFGKYSKNASIANPALVLKKGADSLTKESVKNGKKEFKFLALFKSYPRITLVRFKSAAFTYGGYKDCNNRMYKLTLGKKMTKGKGGKKSSKKGKKSGSKKKKRR